MKLRRKSKPDSKPKRGASKADLAKTVLEEKFAPRTEEGENDLPRKSRYIGKAEMRDFSSEDLWLRENSEKYQGQYVALHGNKLLAHCERLKDVTTKARELGFQTAFFTYIELLDAPPYVGGIW